MNERGETAQNVNEIIFDAESIFSRADDEKKCGAARVAMFEESGESVASWESKMQPPLSGCETLMLFSV